MPFITARDGTRLSYERHGRGPTKLILLHGMGGSARSWQPVLKQLDPDVFSVLVPDLRGHGQSPGGEGHFTFPQMTEDILAVADDANFRQAVVVGMSGSSKNAVHLALAFPERVRGLVLVAPPGMGEVPLPREMLKWMFDYIQSEKRFPPELDPWFSAKMSRERREEIVAEYVGTPRAVLDATAELWVHTSIADEAKQLRHPVLVIAGAHEPVYHPEYQRRTTLAALPHARMEIFECGHFIALEDPAALARSLAEFCHRLD
jgi:pimeloyl-ACP methyl ester carboxylesterase